MICLAIAALLWVVHTLNRNYKYTLHLPVKFYNLPANKLIIGELPDKLDIDIKASGLKLLFISLQDVRNHLEIDFNGLKTNAKSQAYSFGNANLNLRRVINFDVDIIKIRPDTLFFSLNKGFTKMVPVKAIIKTTYLPGFSMIAKPRINPSYITLTGDTTELNQIDTVYTQLLELKDVHQNYKGVLALKKSNSPVNYSNKQVEVSFDVDRLAETSIKIPVDVMNKTTEEKVKLLPDFVTLRYLVSMKDYDMVKASSFKAVVDFHDIIEKQKSLKVELTVVPSEVRVLEIQPENISYLIYK